MLGNIAALIGALASALSAYVAYLAFRAQNPKAKNQQHAAQRLAKFGRPVLIVFLALVLGGVSLLLFLAPSDDEAESRGTAVRLLRQLVSEEAQKCEEVDAEEGAIASLRCSLDKPMRTLEISLYGSVEKLKERETSMRTSRGLAEGKCGDQRVAWERWGSKQGVLMCDYGDASTPAKLEWSRYDSRVFIRAEAREGASAGEIYDWWLSEGNGAPANNQLPYPSNSEERVLETIGLPKERCKRNVAFKSSSAALACQTRAADFLFIAAYESKEALTDALPGRPTRRGSCLEERKEPGRASYQLDGATVGVRHCYEDPGDKTVVVSWTNTNTLLLGFAQKTGSGQALPELFRWWEDEGRLLTR
jgi:hypothetical protein